MKRSCLLFLVFFAPAAGAAYKCVDEKGVTRIGDTPPPECANVPMFEISRSGQVLKKIDPTPTGEQLRQREQEAARKAAADKVVAEQKRKDMALLTTFSAAAEFDVVRDRQIDPIQGRMKQAAERIAAIEKRQKAIDEEMEFYKAGKKKAAGAKPAEPPHMLVAENDRLNAEKKTLQASIVNGEKEIVRLRERYAEDKQRWIALKGASGKLEPAPGASPATTTAPATSSTPVRK